jgi:hypothetical protein
MGGIDWAGLPLACAWLGVRDVDGMLQRLLLIKTHDPKRNQDDGREQAARVD